MNQNKNGQGDDTLPVDANFSTITATNIYRENDENSLRHLLNVINNTPHARAKYLQNKCGLNPIPLHRYDLCPDKARTPKIKFSELNHSQIELKNANPLVYPWRDAGLGIICGKTSGNLEVLDFDNIDFFYRWFEIARMNSRAIAAIKKMPLIKTPSNGRHLLYRCEALACSTKLAYDNTDNIAIETKGQGGYVVCHLTHANTHELGAYELRRGSLESIPTIDVETKNILWQFAIALNEGHEATTDNFYNKKSGQSARYKLSHDATAQDLFGGSCIVELANLTKSPADLFSEDPDVSWSSILEPHGWTIKAISQGVIYWYRPDKFIGTNSATTGYCVGDNGADLMRVFSTNAYPFSNRTYTKFDALKLLKFNGDGSEAYRNLPAKYFEV